jgi:hypothetical protein
VKTIVSIDEDLTALYDDDGNFVWNSTVDPHELQELCYYLSPGHEFEIQHASVEWLFKTGGSPPFKLAQIEMEDE